MMLRRDSLHIRRTGCGLLVVACVVTGILLQVNRVMVISIYTAIVPHHLDYVRLRTIVQFLLIIALLLPEWWLIDRLTYLVRKWLHTIASYGSGEQ